MAACSQKVLGTIGELIVSKTLLGMKFEVFRDITDISKADLVTWKRGKFLRVQVKFYGRSEKKLHLNREKVISRKKYLYTKKDVDVIAYYFSDRDFVVFADIEAFGKKKNMTVAPIAQWIRAGRS